MAVLYSNSLVDLCSETKYGGKCIRVFVSESLNMTSQKDLCWYAYIECKLTSHQKLQQNQVKYNWNNTFKILSAPCFRQSLVFQRAEISELSVHVNVLRFLNHMHLLKMQFIFPNLLDGRKDYTLMLFNLIYL